MTTTRKELLEDIKNLKTTNDALVFENKSLRELVHCYQKFVYHTNQTNKNGSSNVFSKIKQITKRLRVKSNN